MKIKALRKECKKLLIDLELDRPGIQPLLAKRINVNSRSLSMALTGHRTGDRYFEILVELRDYLRLLMKSKEDLSGMSYSLAGKDRRSGQDRRQSCGRRKTNGGCHLA